MKFKIRTLLLLTLIAAILVGSVTQMFRTSAQVRHLRDKVNDVLAGMDSWAGMELNRSQYQADFGLFSSGNMLWDVRIDDQSQAKIELQWRSRLWFGDPPSIGVTHGGTPTERRFASDFIDAMQEEEPELAVSERES